MDNFNLTGSYILYSYTRVFTVIHEDGIHTFSLGHFRTEFGGNSVSSGIT